MGGAGPGGVFEVSSLTPGGPSALNPTRNSELVAADAPSKISLKTPPAGGGWVGV